MRRRIEGVKRRLGFLLQLIFPRRCPFCDEILTKQGTFCCKHCETLVQFVGNARCMKCGKAIRDTKAEYCIDCEERDHAFTQGRILLVYDGLVKKSVYRFKYAGKKAYAKSYVQLMTDSFGAFFNQISPDALVPVPLHPLRFQKRGYNQAELLANEMGKRYHLPVDAKLVKRVKNTRPQKRLDLPGRQNNLKKAFKIRKNDVKLDTIVLIDDIYTTGSTLDALARELKKAGAKQIYFVALAGGVDRRVL